MDTILHAPAQTRPRAQPGPEAPTRPVWVSGNQSAALELLTFVATMSEYSLYLVWNCVLPLALSSCLSLFVDLMTETRLVMHTFS